MPTLAGMVEEAEQRGFTDAYAFRPHGTTLTDYYKGMGLTEQYDRGWKRGRARRKEELDKR